MTKHDSHRYTALLSMHNSHVGNIMPKTIFYLDKWEIPDALHLFFFFIVLLRKQIYLMKWPYGIRF